MRNPFQEETGDLLSLDTKDIVHPSPADHIDTHNERGRIRFQELIKGLQSE